MEWEIEQGYHISIIRTFCNNAQCLHIHTGGHRQDFQGGGVQFAEIFANHTHFLKTTPIIHKIRGTVFNIGVL